MIRGGAEFVQLKDLLAPLGIAASTDTRRASVTLAYRGREVILYDRKSLASVGGDLRLLSAAVLLEEGRWLVPVESIPRFLGGLLGQRVEWRHTARLLLVGDVPAPRIGITTFVGADTVRVVLESSEKVPFRVSQEERRVTVSVLRDIVDVVARPEAFTGGIVEGVQFVGGKENLFAVALGRRFQQLKTTEEEGPPCRLVMEFQARPLTVGSAPSPTPRVTTAPPVVEPPGVRTVVIDPGHGGAEVGAQGPAGTLEKDVTLAFARKLRSALAGLGFQVFLTRDRDQEIDLEQRTAFANNYKADLFISIHANASRSHQAHGSEVYFLAYESTDEESRRLALAEGGELPGVATGPPRSELALILWDMAQAEHLEDSSALASRLQEELAEVTESQGRGVKQAPFRVLVGAAMPAVLVEVAFISNAEEEKLLTSEAYQNKVVGALTRGVARYESQRERRASAAGAGRSQR